MSEVTPVDIKKLREMTGAGMMDCKQALIDNKLDFEKAADELRKKGLSKATKRMDRDTSQGRVISYVHGTGSIGVLLQLNCETDFVAKNDDFEALGKDLCMQIAATNPICVEPEQLSPDDVARETDIIKQQLIEEGKKPDQLEKILPGKLNKFYSEVCLLNQPFVKENKKNVADIIKEHIAKFGENITVARFTRYQIG